MSRVGQGPVYLSDVKQLVDKWVSASFICQLLWSISCETMKCIVVYTYIEASGTNLASYYHHTEVLLTRYVIQEMKFQPLLPTSFLCASSYINNSNAYTCTVHTWSCRWRWCWCWTRFTNKFTYACPEHSIHITGEHSLPVSHVRLSRVNIMFHDSVIC